MQHWAFNRLAAELGDPQQREVSIKESENTLITSLVQLIGMHHTGRSGSTLLCQMFYRLPKTLVLADPFAKNFLNTEYLKGNILRKDADLIGQNMVRLQAKPLHEVKGHVFNIITIIGLFLHSFQQRDSCSNFLQYLELSSIASGMSCLP